MEKTNKIDYNFLLFNDEWFLTMERLYQKYGKDVPQEIMDEEMKKLEDNYKTNQNQ